MTLSISLSRETEAKLLERAAAAGKEPSAYALQLLERAVNEADINENLAPLRAQFAASGTTEDDLVKQITEARDAYRNER